MRYWKDFVDYAFCQKYFRVFYWYHNLGSASYEKMQIIDCILILDLDELWKKLNKMIYHLITLSSIISLHSLNGAGFFHNWFAPVFVDLTSLLSFLFLTGYHLLEILLMTNALLISLPPQIRTCWWQVLTCGDNLVLAKADLLFLTNFFKKGQLFLETRFFHNLLLSLFFFNLKKETLNNF